MQIVREVPIQCGKTKPNQLNLGSSSRCHLMELVWKVLSLMIEVLIEHHGVLDLLAHGKPSVLPALLPVDDLAEQQEQRAFFWK